jgi:alpha-galactosidase
MNKNNSVKIAVSQSPNPEMHYVSGLTLYREQFANGKLIGKRWSANGRTGPEEGFSEPKIDVPCQAFSLNIDGQSLDWGWEFISADVTERDGKRLGTIELRHTVRPVD